MSTYTVHAVRWQRGWELHIKGVGVTQTVKLARAESTVRDFLALDGHLDADTAALAFVYGGPGVDEPVAAFARAREASLAAETAAVEAAGRARGAVHDLVTVAGLSGQDAARVLGVSPQRISQLLGTFDDGSARTRRTVASADVSKAGGSAVKASAGRRPGGRS